MSKYIVNASGDDFFPPDSSQYYYAALSEKKLLFYLPNSGHYIKYSPSISQLASTLAAFYKRIISHQALPVITWNRTADELNIHYSEKPSKIILWSAENLLTRDFRYSCAVHYRPIDIVASQKASKINITTPKQGWRATYIELDFPDGLRASTPIFISPNTFPKKNQIMPSHGMCLLINPENENTAK